MKAKNIIGLGCLAGAVYFLYNKKNTGSSNTIVNNNPAAPVVTSNYSNYTPKTVTQAPVSTPNVTTIDGTPYKNSPLYFGDKTKPYDSFYDFTDEQSAIYLGLGGGVQIMNEDRFNAIRFRIREDVFKVEFQDFTNKKNNNNRDFFSYLFAAAFEVVVPFNHPVMIKEFHVKDVKFCFRNLEHVYMGDFNTSGSTLNTNEKYIDYQTSKEYNKSLTNYNSGIFFGFGEKWQKPFFDIILQPGVNLPVFFSLGLKDLIDKDTAGRNKIYSDENNAMFEVSFNVLYDVNEIKNTYRSGLFYGAKSNIMPVKFWGKQFTKNLNVFIPTQIATPDSSILNLNLNLDLPENVNWDALVNMKL